MALKTFGNLVLADNKWILDRVPPHVCIKLKALFPRIPKTAVAPFSFDNTPETCEDLLWFFDRYPVQVSDDHAHFLRHGRAVHQATGRKLEEILLPGYEPRTVQLKEGMVARPYQLQAADLIHESRRLILGDDLGLGKTLTGILALLKPGNLPAFIVVQTHLTRQWKDEIEKFTNLKVHIIKTTRPYSLPPADIYVTTYSRLSGWVDIFQKSPARSAIFDEVQELRRSGSQKYHAAQVLSESVQLCLGMSATPVYNFGDEIFHILNLLKPLCLGPFTDFAREWCGFYGMHYKVNNPAALGSYLRDKFLFLRRTRTEVGRQLPPINRIVHTVAYDHKQAERVEDLAASLALKIMSGSFVERGGAARELDLLLRQSTGIAKATEVAEYVRILLSAGEPIVLAGWHRDVYEIWKENLAEFNPVFYTGTESDTQKRAVKEAFVSGKTDLFIISLRSGIGLDGLQKRCRTIVIGELDWSPQVHDQLIGRIDRDGQADQVTAIFTVCDYGSDPVIIDLLGLKSSQSHSIINPFTAPEQAGTDDSRIRKLAERFLHKGRQN